MFASHTLTERPQRMLGVFAHPDDEVFCIGGTLAQWTEAGNEAMIVSATRGEAGQIQDASAARRQTLGAVREQELRAACDELGVRGVACLDYHDGALAEVDPQRLAADVAAYIRLYQPDVVVTFGLDGGSGHPDHIAISVATTRACALIASEGGRAPRLYYSEFPRQHGSLCQSLARWLTTRDTTFRGSAEFVRGLALVADEAALMGYADDDVQPQWFPSSFSIIEQGEQANTLYLIISGHVERVTEDAAGRRVIESLGPGQFFGAEAVVGRYTHTTSFVATDTVTCLTLSRRAHTAFDARGADGQQALLGEVSAADSDGLVCMDVGAWLDRKMAALAAHRTQFAVAPELLALTPLWQLMSCEYFAPVDIASPSASIFAGALQLYAAQALLEQPA